MVEFSIKEYYARPYYTLSNYEIKDNILYYRNNPIKEYIADEYPILYYLGHSAAAITFLNYTEVYLFGKRIYTLPYTFLIYHLLSQINLLDQEAINKYIQLVNLINNKNYQQYKGIYIPCQICGEQYYIRLGVSDRLILHTEHIAKSIDYVIQYIQSMLNTITLSNCSTEGFNWYRINTYRRAKDYIECPPIIKKHIASITYSRYNDWSFITRRAYTLKICHTPLTTVVRKYATKEGTTKSPRIIVHRFKSGILKEFDLPSFNYIMTENDCRKIAGILEAIEHNIDIES